MRRYVLLRTLSIVPALLGVSVAVFLLVRLIPGTVVDQMVGTEGSYSEESMRALRAFFGLDAPIHVQYARWLGAVLRGDLGTSWRTGLPVVQMIVSRLEVTVELTLAAMLVALAAGVPLGMLSARRENTTLDHLVRLVSLFSLSIPVFWQATMLILAFSLWLQWAPPVDFVSLARDPLRNLAIITLPGVALGTAVAAVFMRMTRSSLLEVMRQDYIRTARAKGASESSVNYRHALKNAILPVITVIGIEAAFLIGGLIVTETVFNIPGVARFLVEALRWRDYPIVQNLVMLIAVVVVVANFTVDMLYAAIDPRIRYTD